ncbi:redoxin domain-containing protein [Candidatus Azambacteria bacterium]|nr:redoxin domain-containing protein [Candidatus Azambacteria bacterium]
MQSENGEFLNKLPVIGQKVNDMEFEIFQDNKISKKKLSSFKGQWLILFFYPADFTFICPTELEEMADNYDKFKKLGAEIVSVSTDTAFVHKAWHDNSPSIKKIKFPMAADPTRTLTREFGVLIDKEGLALRGTFIINPEGELVAYEVNDNSIGRSAVELIRKLEAAIFVKTHKGQVCPASWHPGEKTLKPGVNLIGKI